MITKQMPQIRTEMGLPAKETKLVCAGSNQPEFELPEAKCVSFTIPYRLKSESNLREHWTKKHKRHKQERGLIALYLRNHTPSLPCHVRLIRIAPRPFDDSNLVSGFKHIQDSVSDHLIPGLAPGRADSDPRIKWSYHQEKGKPKEHAIRIEIYY